jgi:hypothetical protein
MLSRRSFRLDGPGKHWRRRFTGRTEDFREYGEALSSRVNPLLVPLTMEERHPVRERLIAEAHRDWDFLGIKRSLAPSTRR